jgi:threonine synthase
MTTSRILSLPGSRPPGASGTSLVCAGCGYLAPPGQPFVPRCPEQRPGDDIDHVIQWVIDPAQVDPHPDPDPNPFVRYRTRFHAYHVARAAGWTDARYVALVGELDDAIADVEGHGFRTTPFIQAPMLAARTGLTAEGGVWVKDETRNVSGSHKARHLMAVLLELRVAEALGAVDPTRPLAIASCGNAALAAAVIARAAKRPLLVFVPPDAETSIVARLAELGASVETCPRRPGQTGDPAYARLRAAIDSGAIPFTCQGNENGLVIEGGATLGWEIVDQLAERGVTLDRLVVQVGGGALAASQALAFDEAAASGLVARLPRLDTVQTTGAWPLARAFERVAGQLGVPVGTPVDLARHVDALVEVAHHRSTYMWPWATAPVSRATGILDDETYDWLAVVRAMLATGGRPLVVDEATLAEAEAIGHDATGIGADATGTAGVAGLLHLARAGHLAPDEQVAVIFSGIRPTELPAANPSIQPTTSPPRQERSTS